MLNQYQKRKGAYIAHTSYTKESLRTLRPGEWSKKSLGFSMVLILKLPFPCQTSTSAISSRAPLKKPNPQPGVVEHAAPLLQKLVALRAINHWVPGWAWENCTQSLRRLHLPLVLRWQPVTARFFSGVRLDRGFKGCNCCHLYTDVPWCLAMLDGNTQVCQW